MNLNNLFRIAWRAILLNKTRTLLTMLGIIIGVGSVITMLAIGEGSKKSIKENISKMGTNMLNIRPGAGMFSVASLLSLAGYAIIPICSRSR